MNNGTMLQRILYTGTILVLLVALISTVIVIPFILQDKTPGATPENAVFGITIIIALHLPFLVAFGVAIVTSKRGGHLKDIVYIASGIGLIILGLMISDGAVAYARHVEMYPASISIFVCVGCDLVAAVMAFAARRLQLKKAELK
jgi:hypothetical protein